MEKWCVCVFDFDEEIAKQRVLSLHGTVSYPSINFMSSGIACKKSKTQKMKKASLETNM